MGLLGVGGLGKRRFLHYSHGERVGILFAFVWVHGLREGCGGIFLVICHKRFVHLDDGTRWVRLHDKHHRRRLLRDQFSSTFCPGISIIA